MTKAERIYNNTRTECLKNINDFGFKGVGFNSISADDNESVTKRTINDVQAQLDKAVINLERANKLGVLTTEKYEKESNVLKMVQITINNALENF